MFYLYIAAMSLWAKWVAPAADFSLRRLKTGIV